MSAEDSIVKNLKRSLETRDSDEKFYGVVTGRVINLADPMGLGRVQVQLPFIDDLDLSPWARVVGPMAGMFHGTYFVPNPGDDVLVAFEQGDTNVPYIIGSLWNIMQQPPLPSPLPQVRIIRTLTGNQIVFSEVPPALIIQAGPTPPTTIPMVPTPAGPPTIILSTLPAGSNIQIMSGTNVINMNPAGIQITVGSNLITMSTEGITISSATTLKMAATGAIDIAAGGTCTITGSLVKIN
jgi:hypothetical protein